MGLLVNENFFSKQHFLGWSKYNNVFLQFPIKYQKINNNKNKIAKLTHTNIAGWWNFKIPTSIQKNFGKNH